MDRLETLIHKITGKKLSKENGGFSQDLHFLYYASDICEILHELAHFISADEEKRKHPNLGFGKEDDPYKIPMHLLMDELCACQLTYMLSEPLMKFMSDRHIKYIRYIQTAFKGARLERGILRKDVKSEARTRLSRMRINVIDELANLTLNDISPYLAKHV